VAAVWLVGGAISRDFRGGLLHLMSPGATGAPAAANQRAAVPPVDQPLVVKLERPPGPEVLVTTMDALDCRVRAAGGRGIARLGLEIMVDADRSPARALVVEGRPREVTRSIPLPLRDLPGLGPDRSVLLWAFAEDGAGRRAVSAPVVLEIQALYQAESAREGGGGGGGIDPLEQLITDQRALLRKTFPLAQEETAPSGVAPLSAEQEALLARARKMSRP
jgi:hypothetical protein